MSKIALIKYFFEKKGGLEKFANRILTELISKKKDVTILSSKPPINTKIKKINLTTTSIFNFSKLKQFDDKCSTYLNKNNYPIILGLDRTSHQTHMRLGNGVHLAYLEKRKQRESRFKRISFKINPLHQMILNLEKKAFESSILRKIITNSNMVKQEVIDYYRVEANNIKVIHNGVEFFEMEKSFINWMDKKLLISKKLSLDPKAFHFLFIGNGYKRKGLKELLYSISHLKGNFYLSIIGKDSKILSYMKLSKKLKIDKKVHFFSSRDDITDFYALADCLVIPSHYDPFANVTVEALAMGLFVLTSKDNGGKEIITKENGSIIENIFDRDSFVESLKMALTHPKTKKSSYQIRQSVKHLDFSNQMKLFLDTLYE